MAGFKRGGFRGGSSGAYKKSHAKKRAASDDEDNAPRTGKKSKGEDDEEEEESAPLAPELKTNDDGEKFIGLSANGKRRITVREYKNSLLLDIREYWTNDAGELKPGKKGISLNLDQYNTLVAALPLIETVLAEKEATTVRPDYDVASTTTTAAADKDVKDLPGEQSTEKAE